MPELVNGYSAEQNENRKKRKAAYTRTYYLKNRERILARQKGTRGEYAKIYYQKNKQTIIHKQKIYAEENKEDIRRYKKVYGKIYGHKNKEKLNEKQRKYRKNNPGKTHEQGLMRFFNMTADDYKKIFNEQNGCCAVCGTHQSDLPKRLHVDHCHTTQKIRGLLCNKCNAAIGLLKDNIEILAEAIKYLSKNKIMFVECRN